MMARENQAAKTIWTSTFEDRKEAPDAVSNETLSIEQLVEIFNSTPDREKVERYKSKLDESILSATFG